MGISVLISLFLHLFFVVIASTGLPIFDRNAGEEVPIMVEIVNIADVTNVPVKKIQSEAKKKVEQPRKETKVEKNVQEPAPEPPFKEEKVELAIVPPAPKPLQKKKPKNLAEPKKKQLRVSKALSKIRPRVKPKPPDAFASVLKTVEKLKRQPKISPPEKSDEKEREKKSSFEQQIAEALRSNQRSFDQSEKKISISEIDFVRLQIAKCWNPPAGAKDARDMIIVIAVSMNSDGTVRDARITNSGIQSNSFLQAMAESALRAVLNKKCQPFKLPVDKYYRWKTMKLVFNPKELLGG